MSGFVIKYIDIYNLLWEYKEKLETLIEDIGYCENSINDFITSTAFQGEAAASIKNYMNEVHITLLSSFKVTAQNILDNLILYKAGYYEIDSSTNFVLPEEEIKAFRTKLNGNALDTEEYADKVNRKLGEVSDIYQVSHPDTNGVFKIHQQIDQELLNFLTDIETQEQTTVTALEQSAELLISGLKNCVSKIGSIDITTYESNSFYQDAEVYALASLSQNCYQNHETYKGIYDEIWNNEQGLRDAADARETQGIWKTVGGVFLVVGGTVCIVASGGAATPIVAAGWTAGGGTIAFGVADSIEGAQDIYYGSIGDIDSTSINYLKSVVFQGNEDAYYLTENVFAFASSAFIPISQAARVGNLTFRSGVTTVAKEGIAMMAGAGASDVTMRVTGSQTASVVAGMIASGATGRGLNGVDTRFNISGNVTGGRGNGFYKNNPMDNSKAARDIIENSDAVYGYSPNPNSESIGGYADAIDWSNPTEVTRARVRREMYHVKNDNISELVIKMKAEGYSVEEIAREANQQRNLNRLNDYVNDIEGLERVKSRNRLKYGNENGPTAEYLFKKYGSWEKVIEKSMSANPGMDACCGLYDIYFHLYDFD